MANVNDFDFDGYTTGADVEETTEEAVKPTISHSTKTTFSEAAYGTRGVKTSINDLVGKRITITGVVVKDSKYENEKEDGTPKKYVTINFIDESGQDAYVNTGSNAIIDQLTRTNDRGVVKRDNIVEQFANGSITEMEATIVRKTSKDKVHQYFALQ